MYLFLKSSLAIHELAQKLREILNIPIRNRSSYQLDQRRYGDNRGGECYLFEVLGLEIHLLSNAGEVEIPEYREYPYYLFVQGRADTDLDTWRCITRYLHHVLADEGWDVAVKSD